MDDREIFLVEREAVQRGSRRSRQSNRSPLRGDGCAGVQEMLTSIVTRLVDVCVGIHTASQPHDQSRAVRRPERTVGLTTVEGLSAAEESTVGPELVSQACIHISNLRGGSMPFGTT